MAIKKLFRPIKSPSFTKNKDKELNSCIDIQNRTEFTTLHRYRFGNIITRTGVSEARGLCNALFSLLHYNIINLK